MGMAHGIPKLATFPRTTSLIKRTRSAWNYESRTRAPFRDMTVMQAHFLHMVLGPTPEATTRSRANAHAKPLPAHTLTTAHQVHI